MLNPHAVRHLHAAAGVFPAYLDSSIVKRPPGGLIDVHIHNIRDWRRPPPCDGRHAVWRVAGHGEKPEPVFAAIESVFGPSPIAQYPVILLSPQGRVFTQQVAREVSAHSRIALICGRYEGVDERIRRHLATDEISIGDYVLTGGELPALVLIDAIARLLPGVLGDPDAADDDSHTGGLLEYPHYTRPVEFRGYRVPEALLSGDHERIRRWRRAQSLQRTRHRRPDLLSRATLTAEDVRLLAEAGADVEPT
jgi:tRNA (guanine37-N1)-methyltransferase